MPQYGPIVCYSPVIKSRRCGISLTGTVRQKLEVGKWKKIGVLVIQKVAKIGNIGKKTLVVCDIDYVRYLSMQKVNFN